MYVMGLQDYKRKRNFAVTPEPAGEVAPVAGSSFIIQKHAASRLHYDLRLEMEGVLRSWAVPKGPSLDPAEKRLAVHVEDHPLEYSDFEGIIPKGEYGGGTVLLWDRGIWRPVGDPLKGYRKGHLEFHLEGVKLHGRWHLVRLHGRQAGENEQNWLLMKAQDEAAIPGSGDAVVVYLPESVLSGRRIEEITAAPDPVATHVPAGSGGRVEEDPPRKAGGRTEVRRGRRAQVHLTHPDKVLYPEKGVTKAELAAYYERIAGWILPRITGRPLTLVRCPEGWKGQCFYQKHVNDTFPKAVGHIVVEGEGTEPYGIIDSVDGLVSLVQMGALELHILGATRKDIEKPDYVVFDLDPGEGLPWERITAAALLLRDLLAALGLRSFVKTTGGKGLHVCLPLTRRAGWDEVKEFTRAFAESVAAGDPAQFTAKMTKASRKGKIYIDYLRNARGSTSICAYSTRARAGAPVSTPLSWEEIETGPDAREAHWNVRNVPERLESLKADPWEDFGTVRQSITAAMKKAVGLK